MKHALTWIKSNPITVASLLVVLLSLGFLVWVHLQGNALEAKMASRQQVANNVNALKGRTLDIPSKDPDAPPETKSGITVNDWVIRTVSDLYGRIGSEYTKIRDQVVTINGQGHVPLVEGLFPKNESASLPILAQEQYLRSFEIMLLSPDATVENAQPSASSLPRLDAGDPPLQEAITAAVARVDYEFRSAPQFAGRQLTPEDMQTLFIEQRNRAIEIIRNRAESVHIYAATDINDPGFPFDVAAWARTLDAQPKEYQLWEGQMELWIQQDIARAIAMTNRVEEDAANVLTAPVKQLVRIDVLPGYIGLHTLGGLTPGEVKVSSDGLYAAPAALTGSPDRRLPDNFYASPTGRISNALYDVRHARLTVLVDFQRLPELFNALSEVNFMTVLEVEVEDIDEYEALKNGYLYGEGDIVRADILIESVWLRDWTQALMPNLVQQYLGIKDPTELNALFTAGGGGTGEMPYGPGGPGYGPYGPYGPGGPGGYSNPYGQPGAPQD